MFDKAKWLKLGTAAWRERRGSITMMAAIMMPVLLGVTGLGVEYGFGLLTRVQNQRTADLAAYSGALAYNASSSTTTMSKAVSNIASLNGYASTAAVASLVTSPTGDGHQAVSVTVTTNVPLVIAQLFGTGSQLPVSATSYVELTPNSSACVIALQAGGTGVTLSGGTTVSAPGCTVASNSTSASVAGVQVPCGTTLTTNTLRYNSGPVPSQPCFGIKNSAGGSPTVTKIVTSDPLSGNSAVAAATTHLTSVRSMTSPSVTAPSVPTGVNVTFPWYQAPSSPLAMPTGCTLTGYTSGPWTVTCVGAGPFNFGNVVVPSGMAAATFVNATAATFNFVSISGPITFNTYVSNTYNISGSISASGTSTYAGGTYNIGAGIITGGGSTTTFGAGTYNIGSSSTSCGNYSICNTGTTMSFGGPSTFTLAKGIYNNGGSTLSLGAGTSNSYSIGSDSGNGNAIYAGGGSSTSFAAATGVSSLFRVVGMVNVASGGGSCMTLPAAAAHDINGNFSTAGGTTLGAGVYTVNGYVALGANGGGDVSCGGSTVGMYGNNVNFVISGTSTIASGTCSATSFCVAAGYNHVTLTAPTTGSLANLVVMGPTSSSYTAGATFAEGASNTSLSGAFYFPYGPVTLSGGASVGNGTGQCLELIGSQVSLTGGTALASTCTGLAGSISSSQMVLVQ